MFPTGRNAETGCGTTLSFFSQSLYLPVTVTLSFIRWAFIEKRNGFKVVIFSIPKYIINQLMIFREICS